MTAQEQATRTPAARRVRQGEADEAAAESRGPAGVHRGRNQPMFCLRGFAPSRETAPF